MGPRESRSSRTRTKCFREKGTKRWGKEEDKKVLYDAVDIQGACTNLTKHDGLHDGSYKKFISEE